MARGHQPGITSGLHRLVRRLRNNSNCCASVVVLGGSNACGNGDARHPWQRHQARSTLHSAVLDGAYSAQLVQWLARHRLPAELQERRLGQHCRPSPQYQGRRASRCAQHDDRRQVECTPLSAFPLEFRHKDHRTEPQRRQRRAPSDERTWHRTIHVVHNWRLLERRAVQNRYMGGLRGDRQVQGGGQGRRRDQDGVRQEGDSRDRADADEERASLSIAST